MVEDTAHGGQSAEYLSALEALSEGIVIFDSADALVFCNRRFHELTPGLDHILQKGVHWAVFRNEMERRGVDRYLHRLEKHLESGSEDHHWIDAPWPGGRWMRLGLSMTSSGGYVLAVDDITESVEAAELRAEADDLLRHVLDACAANLMMTRINDGKILYRNPASQQLFGKRESARQLFQHPGDRPDMLVELLAAGRVDDFETSLLRGDDTPFPARVSARMVDYGGEDVIVSSAADMTQLYAQRDELAREREASFQNEKLTALGELLAGVAHELNNPLSIVVGQALMLQEETAGSDLERRVKKISGAAERCAKIVKTFLAMARQKPARLAPVSLNAIIETAVDVAGFGIRTTGGKVTLDLADDLPPVLADEDQITQVMINLLVNADQATKDLAEHAGIRIETRLGQEGAFATISDNGPGVPGSIRARIFEPFFSTKEEGAGIGLALCHRIVTGHSGSLKLLEHNGNGAQFECRLPVTEPSDARAPEGRNILSASLQALVVEDETDVADILSEMLGMLGVTVQCVPDGEAAVAAIESGVSPDLILTDVIMPGMGGTGLLRTLRQRWPHLARRLAFITGDSMGDAVQDLGHPVLEKPIAPQELRDLLRKMIHSEAVP